MRFLGLAVLGLVLAVTPAMAQQSAPAASPYNHIFGQVMCRSQIPCSGDDAYASTVVGIASGCVSQHFHMDGSSAFDDVYGLDSNNCLKAKQSGNSFSPNCCVIQTQIANVCDVQCQLLSK